VTANFKTGKYMSTIEIRPATIGDAALILKFVTELAIYEQAEHEVKASLADIEQSLFGAEANAQAVICRINNQAIGFAVYFFNYSTWLGKPGLYLEDLFVSAEHRGCGAGKAMLKYLANVALAKNCGRFEWNVLDWNEPAIKFYQSIGAKPQDEWVGYRLTGKALNDFANA
jgi:GNAT superfamily N-acetyltransferase